MANAITRAIKAAARRAGYDIRRRDAFPPDVRRITLMRRHQIDFVLDVGANSGQYARLLRESGYKGEILSFEPDPRTFDQLEMSMRDDAGWRGMCAALGDTPGAARFHVSENSLCSSLLEGSDALASVMPGAALTEEIAIDVRTLDDVWDEYVPEDARVLVKLDVQGFEGRVIDGGSRSLGRVDLLEVEMGVTAVYRDGALLHELLPRLSTAGFETLWIESGYLDPNELRVVDVDVFMRRRP